MSEERERCAAAAQRHEDYWRKLRFDAEREIRQRDLARVLADERAHAAATALFVERVCIWLSRIAELGAALEYQAEIRRLSAEKRRR